MFSTIRNFLLLGSICVASCSFLHADTGFEEVVTDKVPKCTAPLAQAIHAGNFLFISGQTGNDFETGELTAKGAGEQAEIALHYIQEILRAKNLDFENVIKAQVFVKNMDDYDAINDVYASKFPGAVKPAREMIQVVKLPGDALVEISCIAYIP